MLSLSSREMFSFTSILLTVFYLFYLQCVSCAAVDSHVQLNHFVRQPPAKSKNRASGETALEANEPSKDEKLSGNTKKSSEPRAVRPKRERRQSKYNLLHGMYSEYKFNWHFKSFSLQDASSTKYSTVKGTFKPLIDEILADNQLPVLVTNKGKIWQALNKSLVESYENERGVIVYDQDFFRWVYCGWLTIGSDNFRMCAPLLPLGLEDIERDALKDSDYIPKDTALYLHDYAGKLWPSESTFGGNLKKSGNSEPGMLAGIRNILTKFLAVREDYWLVDLFVATTYTYNQKCLDDNADSSDCSPICCYSTYIGSSFCTEHPMNCIYFGG